MFRRRNDEYFDCRRRKRYFNKSRRFSPRICNRSLVINSRSSSSQKTVFQRLFNLARVTKKRIAKKREYQFQENVPGRPKILLTHQVPNRGKGLFQKLFSDWKVWQKKKERIRKKVYGVDTMSSTEKWVRRQNTSRMKKKIKRGRIAKRRKSMNHAASLGKRKYPISSKMNRNRRKSEVVLSVSTMKIKRKNSERKSERKKKRGKIKTLFRKGKFKPKKTNNYI